MSDTPTGPGSWMVPGGEWSPPEADALSYLSAPEASPTDNPDFVLDEGLNQGTASPKRRRRRVFILALAVAVIALVVGLVVVSAPGSDSKADAAIIRAVNSAIGDKTANIALTESVSAGTSGTFSLNGTGSIDFTSDELQGAMNGTIEGQELNIQVIYLGGTDYESLPQIAQLAPGKNWISLDLSSLVRGAGQSATTGLGGNPLAELQALAQQGNTVTDLGPSSVDGQSVEGYSVTYNLGLVQNEMRSANLPDWMRQAISQVNVSGGSERVYLNGAGELVRLSLLLSENAKTAGVININDSVDFSDYGVPVSISPPPPDQVLTIQQFLQLAGQSTQTQSLQT